MTLSHPHGTLGSSEIFFLLFEIRYVYHIILYNRIGVPKVRRRQMSGNFYIRRHGGNGFDLLSGASGTMR
jgi:hypothetical protein